MITARRLLGVSVAVLLLAALVVGSALAAPSPQTPEGEKEYTNYRQFFLDRLAAALNVSRDQLDQAVVQAGKDTVDQAVADEVLTEEGAARVREKLEEGRAPWGFDFRMPRDRMMKPPARLFAPFHAAWEDVAAALGMSVEELRAACQEGKTLADLADEKGVPIEQVREAALRRALERIDRAEENGRLSPEQAESLRERARSIPLESLFCRSGAPDKRGWPGTPRKWGAPGASSG